MELKEEIERVRAELELFILNELNTHDRLNNCELKLTRENILEASVTLDNLINEYYNAKNLKKVFCLNKK